MEYFTLFVKRLSIVVLITWMFGFQVAIASGILQEGAMPTRSSVSSFSERYAQAADALSAADRCVVVKDYPAAIANLRLGLTIVGDEYYTNDLIDDTGLRLILASQSEKKGDLEGAARYLRVVLVDRLSALRERIDTES